ncbi:DegT/DnrJ/EryC1/StrS family aminotransferase [Dichotomicrobium thermohalophilum]|uniref:dTDP-4-amino-4,6-dideoxygalactose transaminase n=1 Tax=Dichotomicrobium thermohalophilum TaxID=933063 RepID=A0A397PAL8_9HYPH|nr:DegT/DnrJ/EryC1/StrS family aminotransferase [Dichotomicrobium thermohalophilum]RIA45433.1 dTDP-4-amino-4,6-dideoxygalactose transaminase [Dichotomicrobium thermohalophilum]
MGSSQTDGGYGLNVTPTGLAEQRLLLGDQIDQAIARVLAHGQFILGPEVTQLEQRLADFCGARHCVTCASGTDALQLLLMAEGVGPGDAVFVPAFSFVATAEIVPLVGAVPIFVDVSADSFNMDPSSLEAAIGLATRLGLRPRCVIAVDLFGQPADYDAIDAVAAPHGLTVIADAAQSFGASRHGRAVGTLGHHTATSFYPTKPLSCYGDGGAIFTDDDHVADLLRSLRVHGQGRSKNDNIRVGLNSRLDTIQAAILLAKLDLFPQEILERQARARRYSEGLGDILRVPEVQEGASSVWAQYTLVLQDRDELAALCRQAGIPAAVYYPVPLHAQPGYRRFPATPTGLTNAEWLAKHVISLPIHPYLDAETQDAIMQTVRRGLQAVGKLSLDAQYA